MCATHATVRSLIRELVSAATQVTVADMEAGLEHLSRGTPRYVDAIVAVIEPYFKSLETGRKICELAGELGVPQIFAVANKVHSEEDGRAIRAFCERHGLQLLAEVPHDEVFLAADRVGKAPLDLAPQSPGVREIERLARLLGPASEGGYG